MRLVQPKLHHLLRKLTAVIQEVAMEAKTGAVVKAAVSLGTVVKAVVSLGTVDSQRFVV